MPTTPAVSVVVPTRGRPDLLPRSLDALLAQDIDAPYEVVVVDNGRQPLCCPLPTDVRVRVLRCGGRGVAAARNVGIRAAAAPLIAFTDDDTVAPTDWLRALLHAFAEHPQALGVEGTVEYGGPVDPLYEHVPEPQPPGAYSGCNVAYRREALFAVGLFDEQFRVAGGEDIDLGLRVSALGPVVFASEMLMIHPPRAVTALEIVMRGQQVQSDWLLHAKHPDLAARPTWLFGGIAWRVHRFMTLARDPMVTHGSRARAARAVTLGAGTAAIAVATSLAHPMRTRPRVQ